MVAVRRLATTQADFEAEFRRVLHWSAETDDAIEQRVAAILADVQARGDAAVLECTARFDGLQVAAMAALELTADDFAAAPEGALPIGKAMEEWSYGDLEAGFKSEFADRRVRLNGAVYYYTVSDPQFTAVGGAGNLVQLINANKGEGYGFELDSAFQVTPRLLVTLGVAYNSTEIQDPNLKNFC